MFDPLAYAEAYSDVREAYGNDIAAIVNHYVNYGMAEERTLGTANGYRDIATAEENGVPAIDVQRSANRTSVNRAGVSEAGSYSAAAVAVTGDYSEGTSAVAVADILGAVVLLIFNRQCVSPLAFINRAYRARMSSSLYPAILSPISSQVMSEQANS